MVAVVLLLNVMAVMSSAADVKPTDITNDIKWVTAYEMYEKKLPVVRADAVFMNAMDYTAATAPGSGIRMITFTDWAEKGFEEYFDDYFHDGDGFFFYDAVWANSTKDPEPYDHGLLSYTFEVAESGTYELVIVGAGQIKAENVDNDEKDRGFTFQIDDGEMFQVNISDTSGAFRDYTYNYGKADIEAGTIATTNGVNSQLYQMTYYYGMQVYLTAGTHTLNYYHLFYSGEFNFESGNGPRLNYAGAYVQKYLTGIEWDNYVYPETTAPETTAEPETTPAPETTKAPETEAPKETEAPAVTEAPAATKAPETTKAPEKTGGCGSMMSIGAVLAVLPVAALVIKKKRN